MNYEEITKNGGTNLLKNLLRAILVLVTGYMTWSFLQTMMGPDGLIVAALGLVAFEGGMVFWEKYYNDTALSNQQVLISGVMIMVDLTGVALAFVGEVILNRPDVVFPEWLPLIALIGTVVVIIANVAAFIGVSVFDPMRSMQRVDRQTALARMMAELKIKSSTAAQLMADSDQLAIEVAPGRSRQAVEELRRQYNVVTTHVNGVNGSEPLPPFGTIQTPPPAKAVSAKSTRPQA